MDTSQEAANRAQIKSYRVGIIALIVTIIQAVAPYAVIWLNKRGTVMLTGWLPIILLFCSSAMSATAAIIVSTRLLKLKRITQERDSLESDLSEANSNSQRLKNELDAKTQTALALLEEKEKLERQLAPPEPAKLPPGPKPKLDFEIAEKESYVKAVRSGPQIARITAYIKLRCEKETDSIMTARGFHLSLHRREADGQVTLIPHQAENQVIWEDRNGKLISASDGWEVEKPRTHFRYYSLNIDVTPKIQDELSPDHFLQVTMDAIGQDTVSKDVYVKDWKAEGDSPISLKPLEPYPVEAQKEISELKQKLISYEKTNAKLGQQNQQFESLIELAKRQKTEIHEWVKVRYCEQGDLTLRPLLGSHYKVMLSIWVTNTSHLDISLSNELKGFIKFQSTPLRDTKTVASPVINLRSGELGCLTIEQLLSPADVQMLSEAQHVIRPQYFNLDELIVTITGGKDSPDIKPKTLQLDSNYAPAFPINLLERLQRVRALSEIRGTFVQLQEPLRLGEEPLAKEVIKQWQERALDELKKVYSDQAAENIWRKATKGDPIPESAPSQRGWLHFCIVQLGAMLEEEAGQYVRNTKNVLTEQHIS